MFMKRGQLAAVIIIVLLVAAIGAFIVFSEKRAGRAVELPGSELYDIRASQKYPQKYPTIGEPIVGQTQTYPAQPYPATQPSYPTTKPAYPSAGTISTTGQQPASASQSITLAQLQISQQIANAFTIAFSGRVTEPCPIEDPRGKTVTACEINKKTAIFMILMKLAYHDGWKPTLKNLAVKQDKKDKKHKLFIISTAEMPTPVPLPAGAVSMCDLSKPLASLSGAIQYKPYSKYTPAEKTKLFDEMYAIQAELKKCTFKDKERNEIKDDDGAVINLESWLEEKVTDETLEDVYAGLGDALKKQGFESSDGMKEEVEAGITDAKERAMEAR